RNSTLTSFPTRPPSDLRREDGDPELHRGPPHLKAVALGDLSPGRRVQEEIDLASLDHVDHVGPAVADLPHLLDRKTRGTQELGGSVRGQELVSQPVEALQDLQGFA